MKFESKTTPGKFYEVDLQAGTCECPHYQKRMKYTNGKCKHLMMAVNESLKINDKEQEVLTMIQERKRIEYFDLEQKFGDVDVIVQKLLKRGDVMEVRGVLQVI